MAMAAPFGLADMSYDSLLFLLADGPYEVPGAGFIPAEVSDDCMHMLGVPHCVVPDEGLFEDSLLAGDSEKLVAGDSVDLLAPTTTMVMNYRNNMKKVKTGCRIGFRTKSEIEILDDGFKWRKYGKKSLKNSPNPRNYYRCSNEGCAVKKRVERDREDSRYVITTYEGVHNHACPGTTACCDFSPRHTKASAWVSYGQLPFSE